MICTLLFALHLISAASPENITYGDVYMEDTAARELPKFSLTAAYAIDTNNSYLDVHGLVTNAQVRIWRYLGTGLFFHWMSPTLSNAGTAIRGLESVDIHAKFKTPDWGLFSLTQLQLMIGQWNMFNLFPLSAEILVGGGAGLLRVKDDTDAESRSEFSYIWAAEQRFRFHPNFGITVGLFGHTGGVFLQSGALLAF